MSAQVSSACLGRASRGAASDEPKPTDRETLSAVRFARGCAGA